MYMRTTFSVRYGLLLALTAVLSLMVWTCEYPPGALNGNTPPHTRLANVPANDTVAKFIDRNTFPELTLYWVGDDPDGYVVAFQYRWTSTRPNTAYPAAEPFTTLLNITKSGWDNVILVKCNPPSIFNVYNFLVTLGAGDTTLIRVIGDSLATLRTFAVPYKTGIVPTDSIAGCDKLLLQTPTIGTFVFESPVDSNIHRFEVRAVDNSNATDVNPATVYFWTQVSPGSLVTFDTFPVDSSLCVRQITDRWPGLRFAYHSLDANNQFNFQFQWSVDDTLHWSPWSEDGEAFVTALDLRPIQSGPHVFHVRALNRWGVISPDSTHRFVVSVPPFDDPLFVKRTLIINDDRDLNGTRGRPNLNQIDSLYREVMDSLGLTGKYDTWRVAQSTPLPNKWPTRDSLGYYSSVVILMEYRLNPIGPGAAQRFPPGNQGQGRVQEYLQVGGKLIWVGTPYIEVGIQSYPAWAQSVFHLVQVVRSQGLDFNGVRGAQGYPDVSLDTTLIASDSTGADANIGGIWVSAPTGFASHISTFESKSLNQMQGLPVGIRFLAPPPVPPARQTYSVVHFGIPLCYSPKTSVIQSLRKAFEDINEISN